MTSRQNSLFILISGFIVALEWNPLAEKAVTTGYEQCKCYYIGIIKLNLKHLLTNFLNKRVAILKL